MNKLIILALILAVASAAGNAAWIQYTNVSIAEFKSLKADGTERVVLEVCGDDPRSVSENFRGNYARAKIAEVKYVDAVTTLIDYAPADIYCADMAHNLPSSFNGTLWLIVHQKGLSPYVDRIPFIESVASICQGFGIKIGIMSNQKTWETLFGSFATGSSSKILSELPLWYYNPDGQANFVDFDYLGFGPWNLPFMKTYVLNKGPDGNISDSKTIYKELWF